MKAFSHVISSGLPRSRSARYTPELHGRPSTTLIGARSLGLSLVRVRPLAELATESLPLVSVISLSPTACSFMQVCSLSPNGAIYKFTAAAARWQQRQKRSSGSGISAAAVAVAETRRWRPRQRGSGGGSTATAPAVRRQRWQRSSGGSSRAAAAGNATAG